MKMLHQIYEGSKLVGTQVAGTPERAIHLWCKRTGRSSAGLKAYDINMRMPGDQDNGQIEDAGPEDADWYARDLATIAANKTRKAARR